MSEVIKYLESKNVENIDEFFTFKSGVFGGESPEEFVETLVAIGNYKTKEDAWRAVLGIARKMYE